MTKRSDPMNEGKRRAVWPQSHGAMGKARIWPKITPFHKEPSQVPVEKPKKCCHWAHRLQTVKHQSIIAVFG
jgi:hypothetical protein